MSVQQPLPMRRGLLYLFLFVSGWCALTYQVCWERLFIVNFGVDFYSVSAITAAFMTGLGIGALLLGRYVDRHANPLRVYALLEAGIGVFGLLSVIVVRALYPLCIAIQQHVQSLPAVFGLNFLVVFIVMLPPTIMMGGTLPVVVRLILRSHAEAGRTIGGLYAINTLGSVIGSFMGAFITISLLNVDGSIYLAGLMNVAIGVTCWRVSRRAGRAPQAAAAPVARASVDAISGRVLGRAALGALLGLYVISSVVALGYEILWFRIVSLQWQNATGGFGLVLSFYLMGVVLGSWLFAWISPRVRAPIRLFAMLQFLTVAASFGGLMFFRWGYHHNHVTIEAYLLSLYELLTGIPNRYQIEGNILTNGAAIGLMLAALITLPMIVQGMCFPLVARVCTSNLAAAGRSVGRVYFLSIVGSFLGSAGVGYLAMPWLGLRGTCLLLLGLSVFSGTAGALLSMMREGPPRARRLFSPLPEACLAAAVLAMFLSLPASLYAYLTGRPITVEQEGITGVTQLAGDDDYLAVIINGQNHGGLTPYKFQRDDLKMAIAVNLHPNPRTALLIGLGNGRTLVALEKYREIERIDVVEISRELIPALLRQDGIDWLHRALKSPKVHIHLDDGRAFLNKTDQRYDLIVSAPVFAYNAYGGYLYSREMLELVAGRLNPRGIYVLLNDSLVPTMRFIQLATFASVFPHYYLDAGNYLHGSREPLTFDFERIDRSYELNRDWLGRNEFAIASSEYGSQLNPLKEKGWFLQWIKADQGAFRDLQGFPLNTDLAPRTEFWLLHDLRAARQRPEPQEVRNVALHMPTIHAGDLAGTIEIAPPVERWRVDVIGGRAEDVRSEGQPDGGLRVALARPGNVKIHAGAAGVLDPPTEAERELARALPSGRPLVVAAAASGSGIFELQLRAWDEQQKKWDFLASQTFSPTGAGQPVYLPVDNHGGPGPHSAYRLSLGFNQPCDLIVRSVSLYERRQSDAGKAEAAAER